MIARIHAAEDVAKVIAGNNAGSIIAYIAKVVTRVVARNNAGNGAGVVVENMVWDVTEVVAGVVARNVARVVVGVVAGVMAGGDIVGGRKNTGIAVIGDVADRRKDVGRVGKVENGLKYVGRAGAGGVGVIGVVHVACNAFKSLLNWYSSVQCLTMKGEYHDQESLARPTSEIGRPWSALARNIRGQQWKWP